MQYEIIRYNYSLLTHKSPESDVDDLWNSILPQYFGIADGYSINHQQSPWSDQTKTKADFIIRHVANGVVKNVIFIEDKRVNGEQSSSIWKEGVEEVKQYMNAARASLKKGQGKYWMFAIVTVGHYSRFYELSPKEHELQDYRNSGGNLYEFKRDEDDIDRILLELVQLTS